MPDEFLTVLRISAGEKLADLWWPDRTRHVGVPMAWSIRVNSPQVTSRGQCLTIDLHGYRFRLERSLRMETRAAGGRYIAKSRGKPFAPVREDGALDETGNCCGWRAYVHGFGRGYGQ